MAFKELPPSPKEQRPALNPAATATRPVTPPTAKDKDYRLADPAPPAGPSLPIPAALKEPRLVSLDAYRGLIMLFLASAGFGIAALVHATDLQSAGELDKNHPLYETGTLNDAGVVPGSTTDKIWRGLAHQLEHVPWQGGVLWDMIQPAFMFMVGAALPYSFARRAARGDSYISRFVHMLGRSVALVLLAVYLSTSSGAGQTNWIFTNVLAQIGLGYPILFLFVNRPRWLQLAAVALIAGGWWYAFYQHPLPPADFDYAAVGLKENADKSDFVPPGIKQHWAYNTNFAAAQDRVILNRFPRPEPFEFNDGGYTTLNFVPSLITMLLGLISGEILRLKTSPGDKLKRLAILVVACAVAGFAAHYTCCPIVKRIWTPSWAFVSGAAVIGGLMLFYLVIDVGGWKRLAWPLAVVGMNSIVMYMMAQMLKKPTARLVKSHLALPYRNFAEWMAAKTGLPLEPEPFSTPYAPIYESLAVVLVFWLVCVWLYRQRLFVRL